MQLLTNLLYTNADADISMLLRDIGIKTVSHKGIKRIIAMDDNHMDIVTQIGIKKVLTVLDKLMMAGSITTIINAHGDTVMRLPPMLIINHKLDNDDTIVAYANKYKVVHNGQVLATDELPKAVANGMVVASIGGNLATDRNIARCTLLRELNIVEKNDDITTLKPFAKNLKKLKMHYSNFTDDDLAACISLEELHIECARIYEEDKFGYVSRRDGVLTTCAPFAKTLRKLSIAEFERIGDFGLQMCCSLTELDANDNKSITTCAPFAHSLRKLFARCECGINDNGLRLCKFIEKLDARSNPKITTCKPFAKSIYALSIGNELRVSKKCKINNKELCLCASLTYLDAGNDIKITTCGPFAKSLRILKAYDTCGITDNELQKCKYIEELYIDDNNKITTCDSFSKYLRKLSANGRCALGDDGLCLCVSLRELHADQNAKITTCTPFAKSLRILFARNYWTGGVCGIDDDGLRLCTSIVHLNASHNWKITTCEPFAKSLRILSADTGCGISDDGLKLCSSIENLDISDNDNITTCAPFASSLRILRVNKQILNKELCLCAAIEHIDINKNKSITTYAPFIKTLKSSKYYSLCCDSYKHIDPYYLPKKEIITRSYKYTNSKTCIFRN